MPVHTSPFNSWPLRHIQPDYQDHRPTVPNIEAMAATLEALAVLSAEQEIDSDTVHEFIGSLYVPDNGGFGPRPGLGTTPPSTYHAIFSLVRLGKLPDPMVHKPPAAQLYYRKN